MLIGGLPVTNRATVLRTKMPVTLKGSISRDWNWCLHRAMRAVELECAAGGIQDQPTWSPPPRLVARARSASHAPQPSTRAR
jgi:hypothetical protein